MNKYNIVRQLEETDCGCACIATICKYYGKNISISDIRHISKTDKQGTNMYGLYISANELGFTAKALFCNQGEFGVSKLQFPLIAHVIIEDILEHFVVLFEVKDNTYIVGDPGRGIIEIKKEDFFKIWTGHILTLKPTDKFKERNQNRVPSPLIKYLKLFRNEKKTFAIITLISLFLTVLSIFTTYYYSFVLDNIIPKALVSEMIFISIAVGITYIFISVFGFIRSILIANLNQRVDAIIMNTYGSHIIKLPMSFYSGRTIGDITSRFNDADTIRESISNIITTVMLDMILVIVGSFFLLYQDMMLFTIALLISFLYGIVYKVFSKKIYKSINELKESSAYVSASLIETINGVEVFKTQNAEKELDEKNHTLIEKMLKKCRLAALILAKQNYLAQAIIYVGEIAILCVGGLKVLSGQITVGVLLSFSSLYQITIEPIKNIIELQPTIQGAKVSAERLNTILDMETEQYNKNDLETISLATDIVISNITYRYGNHNALFNDFSLKINQGEHIAIIGENGSGKTTLAKLLLNLYQPENGHIYFGDREINTISLNTLRKRIAYIPQNVFLIRGTVEDNIKLGNKKISREKIIEVCNKYNLSSFIEKLPFGLDTFVDEEGRNFSGGQKQIISMLRALVKDFDLLIFDEATSALDCATDKIIQYAINKAAQNKTFITILHQSRDVEKCDKVLILKDGKIEGFANHNELIKTNKYYKEIIR